MIWQVIVSRLQEGLVASPTQARAEQSSYSHPVAPLLGGSLTYSGPGARARRGGPEDALSGRVTDLPRAAPLSFLTPDLTPNWVQSWVTAEQCAHRGAELPARYLVPH